MSQDRITRTGSLSYKFYQLRSRELPSGGQGIGVNDGVLVHHTEAGWEPVASLDELKQTLNSDPESNLKLWVDQRKWLVGKPDGHISERELQPIASDPRRRTFRETESFMDSYYWEMKTCNRTFKFEVGPSLRHASVLNAEGMDLPLLCLPEESIGRGKGTKTFSWLAEVQKDTFSEVPERFREPAPRARFDRPDTGKLFAGNPDVRGRALNEIRELDGPRGGQVSPTLKLKVQAILKRGPQAYPAALEELKTELSDPRHQAIVDFALKLQQKLNYRIGNDLEGSVGLIAGQTAALTTALEALTLPIDLSVEQCLAKFGHGYRHLPGAASLALESIEACSGKSIQGLSLEEIGEGRPAPPSQVQELSELVNPECPDPPPKPLPLQVWARAHAIPGSDLSIFDGSGSSRAALKRAVDLANGVSRPEALKELVQILADQSNAVARQPLVALARTSEDPQLIRGVARELVDPPEEVDLATRTPIDGLLERIDKLSQREDSRPLARVYMEHQYQTTRDPDDLWLLELGLEDPGLMGLTARTLRAEKAESELLTLGARLRKPGQLQRLLAMFPPETLGQVDPEVLTQAARTDDVFYLKALLETLARR